MTSLPLTRTEYWNVSQTPPIPRTGSTAHGESITDMEGYLLPAAQALASSLHGAGVAEGLTVSAVSGQAGLTIAPGVALDAAGHLIALAAGGAAVVDPNAGAQVQGVVTAPVPQGGLVFATDGISGDFLLTITWREALDQGQVGNVPVLVHAPWLRLAAVAGFADEQVVLARASLDSTGLVTALSAGVTQADGSVSPGRRSLVTQGTQVALRAPAPAGLTVGDVTAGTLLARDQATVELAASAVSVVAGSLSLRAPGDPQGTERVSLDGTTSTVSAASVLVGGAVSVTASSGGVLALSGVGSPTLLGVGTAAPRNAVGIRGATASEELISFEDATGATTWHVNQKLDAQRAGLNFAETGVADGRLFLKAGGKGVGIGTTTPGFELEVAGTVCAGQFCNPSDLRVKRDVTPLAGVLDRLAGIKAVSYRPDRGERPQIGVIAQDVQAAFPELVVETEPGGLKAVDYAGLSGVLVGAVHELLARNAALAARLAEVERLVAP